MKVSPRLRKRFTEMYSDAMHSRFVGASAPGRLEVSGNHTDHQGGCVLSAAIGLRMEALAAPNGRSGIRADFEGFGSVVLPLPLERDPKAEEAGQPISLLRGMAAAHIDAGGALQGFDLAVCSQIPAGAGVSSSAALEMLIGAVLRMLDRPDGVEELVLSDDDRVSLALQGQFAERRYFGKLCGAQDQLASALGGLLLMDFSGSRPEARRIPFDFREAGYDAVLVNSGVDHAAYQKDYDQVPKDMAAVAACFGAACLNEVDPAEFAAAQDEVAAQVGAGAVLRAQHFFEETRRVVRQAEMLEAYDLEGFLHEVIASGRSSEVKLRNVSPRTAPPGDERAHLMLRMLRRAEALLSGRGAWRIHGGGFGGCMLAIVAQEDTASFIREMEGLTGQGSCIVAGISPEGVEAFALSPEQALASFEWVGLSPYGDLQMTVNLLKPEKDPLHMKEASCALCGEVARFHAADELSADPRILNPRFSMGGEEWLLHYSPYGYYPKHCVVMSERHRPMRMSRRTCELLLECVNRFPGYFMGSNADLPIVGGSILEHDHFQGGEHVFPLMRRPVRCAVRFPGFSGVEAGIVDWPASTLRLVGRNAAELAACFEKVLCVWRGYESRECGIIPRTGAIMHSTVTLIAYRRPCDGGGPDAACAARAHGGACAAGADYVLDVVLRNNRTTLQRPFGLFHPGEEWHHIKKENIGLIEVMGRAILPPRALEAYPALRTSREAQREVAGAFGAILASTGVFKNDESGLRGWNGFIRACDGIIEDDSNRSMP